MKSQWFRSALEGITHDWLPMLEAGGAGGVMGGERNPSRPPLPIEVLSLRHDVTAWLAGMCLLVIEERGLDTRNLDGNDALMMCGWLNPHAEWVVEHEAGEAFLGELQELARQVHGVAEPREPKPDVVVSSPAMEGGSLVRDRFDEGLLRCTVTGTAKTPLDWYRQRFPDVDRDVTIAELAEADGVKQDRIRDRLRAMKMEPTNSGRRPALYSLAEWEWLRAKRRTA